MEFLEISNSEELCNFLKIEQRSLKRLIYLTIRGDTYKSFLIKKRNGDDREINAPKEEIKKLQRRIFPALEKIYQPPNSVQGYIKKRSIISNAKRHLGANHLLKIDIKNFFTSIHFGRVRGLFLNEPFNFNQEVAEKLAGICCFKNSLPQGSIISPIISNMICYKLDRQLIYLAKQYKCYYTRYADDIIFSSKYRLSNDLVDLKLLGDDGFVTIGVKLMDIINQNGFSLNESKTRYLMRKKNRQLVTGLVINEKINVPRKFIRQTRAMIHNLLTKTAEEAAKRNKIFNHNRYLEEKRLSGDHFIQIVKGRIQYIGLVRGWDDSLYLKYAQLLEKAAEQHHFEFKINRERSQISNVKILVEGESDVIHLKSALRYHPLSKWELQISAFAKKNKKSSGKDELIKFCEEQCRENTKEITICIFDNDLDEKTDHDRVMNTTGKYKDWGNNIYSLVLPIPSHREGIKHICIEYLYDDNFIKELSDDKGRILYLKKDFDKNGFYKENKSINLFNAEKKTLVAERVVSSLLEENNIAMSKMQFANLIKNRQDKEAFNGFRELFSIIQDILKKYSSKS